MIAEALKYLAGQAKESVAPLLVAESPSNKSYLIDGGVVDVPQPLPSREHGVDRMESIIELANRFAGEDSPVVWLDEDGVILVVNDDDHRNDRVMQTFEQSDVFALVKRLAVEKPWFEQKPFIRMLRVELNGVLPDVILLDRVRTLKFENGQSTTGQVMRGRESLGREITSKVEAPEIPESVTLQLPVYKLGPKYPVECAVDIDPARGMLQLIPYPDQIERVVDLALGEIEAGLRAELESAVKLYRGRP